MIQTGFESRVKVQQIIENQLPSFILDENPNAVEFLKQYYISQEYQGGPIDIAENLDQYLELDKLIPEVIVDNSTLSTDISASDDTIEVSSTKGFPSKYGLFKIDDEVITYTGISGNTFTGCIRGFSGITGYHQDLDQEELVFSETTSDSHTSGSTIENLSSLFLKEFYEKIKYTLTPELQKVDFTPSLKVSNFLKETKSFYTAKGTDESFRILFAVLYNEKPTVLNLEQYLIKPSSSEYLRREVVIAEVISLNFDESDFDASKLSGRTIKKTNDSSTSASISSIEPFRRGSKTYYKLFLFVGYNEFSAIEGNFEITPSTKSTLTASVGSNVLTVDSTIGFEDSGTLISGSNTILYTGKSINQFLGCSGISNEISKNSLITSDKTYYVYQDNDISKKVELRFLGVISDFIKESENIRVVEGSKISIKNLGDVVKNPIENKTYKEIFANSWIYNTAAKYEVDSIESNYILNSNVDKSSLKVGDRVELLERNGEESFVAETGSVPAYIDNIITENTVKLEGSFDTVPSIKYDLRRKINTSFSSGVPIEYGNNIITSDIQNVYTDGSDYAYVASNSLPSGQIDGDNSYRYNITKNIFKFTINSEDRLLDKNLENQYSIILSDVNIPFITGDRIYYQPDSTALVGLETGSYYVEVLSNPKQMRLYSSRSFIGGTDYETFSIPNAGIGTHTFSLYSQKEDEIGIQKIFKKFPLNTKIKSPGKSTTPGTTGMLINGVEISNYKSFDKVYYGPLSNVEVFNQGSGYDVLNPPVLEVSSSNGTTALVQPVVSGKIENVYIDTQNYDIDKILSIDISGGNGSGAIIEPIITQQFRSVSFDGRQSTNGGGIGTGLNRIQFTSDHNFQDGEEIVYNNNGNLNLSIDGSTTTLIDKQSYFVKVENNRTISLFETQSDYNLNINKVGFSTGTDGIHKFRTSVPKNKISTVKILDSGSGYANRKLIVLPTGISTENNTINFANHGFNTGELITYNFETSGITGISTSNQYFVIKIDDDSFRICNAGVGGTIVSEFNRRDYIKFSDTGSGYQYFNYPDVSVTIKYSPVGFSSSSQQYQELSVTPVVKGSIVDTYLYEKGTGYGSTVLNYEEKPVITIKNGKNASLSPNIIGGEVQSVTLQYGGAEYYSIPELEVFDPTGSGTGAVVRATISNGKISNAIVVNPGISYSTSSSIRVKSSGTDASFGTQIRYLTVNNNFKFGDEILLNSSNKLKYTVSGYFNSLRTAFKESSSNSPTPSISKIIGWAYDGNPIYGPFGYSDPDDETSTKTLLSSGYSLNSSNVVDRPLGFIDGFFNEDYQFLPGGDLDKNNGRFAKTIEFPNGVYAYYATIDSSGNPVFPYFIGDEYTSETLDENESLDQSFDFKSSNLLRNTLPYKVSDIGAGYDYFTEIDDITRQKIKVESVFSGSIDDFEIINFGDKYSVGDSVNFDNTGTSGGGLNLEVSSIKGKDIVDINTSVLSQDNFIISQKNSTKVEVTSSNYSNHNFNHGDYITFSNLSNNLSDLNGTYKISVPSESATSLSTVTSSISIGGTELYLSNIPNNISIGSSIGIGTEFLEVLGVFEDKNILKVKRGLTGTSHNKNSIVTFYPDSFTIEKELDYFDSKVNDKVYFNPQESVGFGTTVGSFDTKTFDFGIETVTRSVPTKSIYVENHPFKNNQKLSYSYTGSLINVSTDGVNLIGGGLPSTVYVSNKGKDLIGLKASIGTSEFFFHSGGDDNDYEYYFNSDYTQETGTVSRVKATVSVSTAHGMLSGDLINLTVNPNLSVGIASTSVKVIRDLYTSKILINQIGFNSAGVNTTTNTITIPNHNLSTGDKVNYSADVVSSGLSTGDFYVYKVNDNNIKLCETYIDSTNNPPLVVSIGGTGGSDQKLSSVNPKINSFRNNNLVFDLSDSSLSGYDFNIYYDKEFKSKFVSTASTSGFNISRIGTDLIINYDSNIPEKLYYAIEKSGVLIQPDKDVKKYSEISFVKSYYNGNYNIIGVGTTTFELILDTNPEKSSYLQSECDILEYTTNSPTSTGSIDDLKIISSGSGYKKLPEFNSITSSSGENGKILPKSNKIGNIKEVKIINQEFEYPFDTTLQPNVLIPSQISIKDFNTIDEIIVSNGGGEFLSAPNVVIVSNDTRKKIDSGFLQSKITGSSIQSIEIVSEPQGLPDNSVEIFTTNNSNGITIQRMQSSNSGIFTCEITKPSFGLPNLFDPGDEVFIEGIQKYSSDGLGFNSEDFGYKFLTVDNYIVSSPYDLVVFDVSDITTNTGTAKTIQDGSGIIVNKNNYPEFEISLKRTKFLIGESLILGDNELDLIVTNTEGEYLTIDGSYDLSAGQTIIGKNSGVIATVDSVSKYSGKYSVKYSSDYNLGWSNEIGKLDSDTQVTPNNDYYQNLSYSVKSSKEYSTLESPVFSILHTSGMKNFADTKIDKTSNVGFSSGLDESIYLNKFEDSYRVDAIYNFDLTSDYEVVNGTSKYLKLKNIKTTDYTEYRNSEVLSIDDISNLFSYYEDEPSEFLNILKLDNGNSYNNYLIKITNSNNTEIQFTELITLNTGDDQFIIQKANIQNNTTSYGEFELFEDEFGDTYLRFIPVDAYDTDYDLKLIKNSYTSSLSGIGSTSIGFVDLISSNKVVGPNTSSSIVELNSSNFESLYANVQVIDNATDEMNFVELYVVGIGTNTFISEYYSDSDFTNSTFTSDSIGSFEANLNGGTLSLNYDNVTSNTNTVRAKIVGFGTTSLGESEYRFKTNRQTDGSERTVVYQSNYVTGIGATTVVSLNKNFYNAVKSIVEVSIGSTKAVHQVMMVQDGTNVYVHQSPLLSVSGINTFDTALGIGTFGGNNSGSTLDLTFTPEAEYSSYNLEISAFSQYFYTDYDIINTPKILEYGSIEEEMQIKFFNSINGDRINRTNFSLTSDGFPIFVRIFDPQDTNALISTTGVFNINNHFFKNNEELIYTPKSSVIGLATTAMTYNDSTSGVTDILPSTVFAIVNDYDTFQISTTRGGTPVTFTDLGGGNIHQFEMFNKVNKTIVTIDELIQHPLIYSGESRTLSGTIGTETTLFELNSISRVNPSDILKIEDEYVRVDNVGLGTTSVGPITNNGTFNLVLVERGFVGTSSTSHSASTTVDIYRGAYNIVGNEIHFAEPPRGNPQIDRTSSNLNFDTSTFAGRVFLRSDYTTNKIYDDISNQFNGIGRTFTLQVGGANTSGIGTIGGNGIILINGIFQQPSTENNINGNFNILETKSPAPGISSVVFSGVTKPNSDPIEFYTSEYDINVNETPRGGIIISYGSTTGLGFAPLVGASVTAIIGAGGTIAGVTTSPVLGSYGSGYYGPVSVAVTETGHTGSPATITAVVGAGGTLSFNIDAPGSGYNSPSIFVSPPSYENLSVIGVSRLGIGTTTTTGIGLSMSLKVGPVGQTGAGATYFGVTDFEFTKIGYSFQRGDVFKPVGLVTDGRLASPIEDFEITVIETYTDKFASWEFGELDMIDNISPYQDGQRTSFPLFYNSQLRSIQAREDSRVDFSSSLLIFINGIIQEPGFSYIFGGGTSVIFTTPPKKDDNVTIYFYKGLDSDVVSDDVDETLKVGDEVQLLKNNYIQNSVAQEKRVITDLTYSDKFETNPYIGPGIESDENKNKPLLWIKQKSDKIIGGEVISKARDSLKALIYPTANIIGDISVSDDFIFVDDVTLFRYENDGGSYAVPFNGLVVDNVTVGVGSTASVDYVEFISDFNIIQGITGDVTGITSITSPQLGIEFAINDITNLQVGYPIYITNTNVGSGVTSINLTNTEIIAIGTTYLDNIYRIQAISNTGGSTGIITCYVDSNSNLSGIDTTGSVNYPVGRFSWGRISNPTGLERLNPIGIGVTGRVVSGLSTYPIIMRRGGDVTLRGKGSIYNI